MYALLLAACLSGDPFRLEPNETRPPESAPKDRALPSRERADIRPVVTVHCLPARLCAPCGEFLEWHKANAETAPFQFKMVEYQRVADLPQWVLERGTPCFHFNDAAGRGWATPGWYGPAALVQQYQTRVPEFGKKPVVAAPKPGTIPENLRKFLGASGTIEVRPDSPIRATLDDGSVITYSRLSAKYRVDSSGNPVLTLSQPLPEAHVRRWGFWFGAQILGATGNLEGQQPTVTIETTQGKYTVKLEPVE